MKDDKNYGLKKIIVLGLILVIFGMFLVMFQNNGFPRPFEDFNGPDYVPDGYNNTENMTDDNERIFEYSGNGTFYVGVIKNTTTNDLHDIMNPFEEDPENVVKKSENITVNGHHITFQTSEYLLNLPKTDLKDMIPSGYNMPTNKIPDMNINMVKFQATWYCNETSLTYVATGLVTPDKLEEMKKTTTSIKCHQLKKTWNLLKL